MPIYRLLPSAPPDDPNWDRALNQGEVVVRAASSGAARAMAALATFGPRAEGLEWMSEFILNREF